MDQMLFFLNKDQMLWS
uniref:Uncharacterized protein n=1 Tax=Arundo donax TaxID=35708 RepID=A0A0A9ABQ6_ARUDO